MTSQTNTIFPIKFNHNGVSFETKALKHAYNSEVLYKIAIPSAVSNVQQCWITQNKNGEWNLIMGEIDQALAQQMITAIQKQEQIFVIYSNTKASGQKLKSA